MLQFYLPFVNTSNLYSFHEVICWVGVQNLWIIIYIMKFWKKNFGSNVFIMIICDFIGFWWRPALSVINLQHITDLETQLSTNWIALATNQAWLVASAIQFVLSWVSRSVMCWRFITDNAGLHQNPMKSQMIMINTFDPKFFFQNFII